MREYKKVKKGTEVTKVLCDTCKKEIPMLGSGKRVYVPSAKLITARRKYSYGQWSDDTFDFCSLECFLEWAKGETDVFEVWFPRDVLNNLASEYARLKRRDSRLTDIESANEEII